MSVMTYSSFASPIKDTILRNKNKKHRGISYVTSALKQSTKDATSSSRQQPTRDDDDDDDDDTKIMLNLAIKV